MSATTSRPSGHYSRQLYARRLARRRAWRAARGDADAYREIMQAHLETGFLYYYDEPAPARSTAAEIWRDCARRAAMWTVAYAVLAAVGLILQAFGVLVPYLPMS